MKSSRLFLPLVAVLQAFSLVACSQGRRSGGEMGGSETPGEHVGMEGEGEGEGGGEESATQYGLDETFDMVRAGARLVLRYAAATQTFTGTVENTTGATLQQVRVEVHLSNGVELGPTTPQDLAPGQTIPVTLSATGQVFDGWTPHAEVGPQGAEQGGGSEAGEGGGSEDPGEHSGSVTFVPKLGGWTTMNDSSLGIPVGIEHTGFGLRAGFTISGNTWTPNISPSAAPEHQPTVAATWSGEWAGYLTTGPTLLSGDARVTVTLGAMTEAVVAFDDVPVFGTFQSDKMPVVDGRFTGTSFQHEVTGQFGGPNQEGVVGYTDGLLRSVFYGQKTE